MNKGNRPFKPKIRIKRPRIRIKWRKKTSRWVLILAACFFAGLFTMHILLLQKAESLIRQALDDKIMEASDGLYHTAFDEVELSYTSQKITIYNLQIRPDSNRVLLLERRGMAPRTLISTVIPKLVIDDIGLRKAYLSRILSLDYLEIDEATVNLAINYDAPTPLPKQELKTAIEREFAPFFYEFQIGTVLFTGLNINVDGIKNGEHSFVQSSDIKLRLDGFRLKARNINTKEKFLWLDDIKLSGADISGALSDSTYLIKLGAIELGKQDSTLYLENVGLLPLADAPRLIERHPQLESIYTIRIPQIFGYGLDYNQLYNYLNFDLRELSLLSPSLELYNVKPVAEYQREPFKPQDLYNAIDKVLNRLKIEQLSIRLGESLISQKFDSESLVKFNTNIREAIVYNFVLDSVSMQRNDQLFFSDSIKVDLRDYRLRLGDQVHVLVANQLLINSNQNLIYGENFRLIPDTTTRAIDTTAVFYYGQVKELAFNGIDINLIYNQNKLSIDSLRLQNPLFSYQRRLAKPANWDAEENNQQKRFNQSDVYTLISSYLSELNINYLALDNGLIEIDEALSYDDEIFTTKLRQAKLWNFQIDSSSAYTMKKLFNAEDFELDIEDYKHHLPDDTHTILAKSLLVSTKSDRIILSDLLIKNDFGYSFPFNEAGAGSLPSTLMEIQIPRLELNGLDVLDAYLNKQLLVDEVNIPNPIIKVGSKLQGRKTYTKDSTNKVKGIVSSRVLYVLMQPYFTRLLVNNLNITDAQVGTAFHAPNGSLVLNSAVTNITVNQFKFDSVSSQNVKRLFFAQDVKVNSKNLSINLPDSRYQIAVEELTTSTSSQRILAKQVILDQPGYSLTDELLLQKEKKGMLRFVLPQVELTGVDFDQAYYQDRLQIDTILTIEPDIVFHYATTPKKSKITKSQRLSLQKTDLHSSISPFINAININHTIIKHGDFATTHTQNSKIRDRLKLTNISLAIDGFRLDSTAAADTKRFFYSDDIRLHIDKYAFPLPDGSHLLSARNLEVSTRNNLVILFDVKLQPQLTTTQSQQNQNKYFAKVPEIILAGVNFDGIFDEDLLQVEKMDLINPNLDISIHEEQSNDPQKKGKRLNLAKGELNTILLGEANIIGARINYINHTGNNKQPFELSLPNVSASVQDLRYDMLSTAEKRPFYAENFVMDIAGWRTLLPDSIHYIEPERLSFSATDSILTASKVKIYPRTDVEPDLQKARFTASVPQILFEGVNLNQIQNDTFSLSHIRLLMPELEIYSPQIESTAALQSQEKVIKANSFKGLIKVDSMSIRQARVKLNTVKNADTSGIELNHVYLSVKGTRIDRDLIQQDSRILFSDNIRLGVKGYSFRTDDGLYDVSAKEMGLDTENTTLWMDSLRVIPAVDRDAFAKTKGYETDQFTFINKRLEIQDIDLQELIYHNNLVTKRIFLDGFNLGVYRDKRQPFPEDHYPPMPQTSLRKSKLGILIKEVTFINGYISYSERVKGGGRTGFIDLTDITVTSDTISNLKSVLDLNYVTNLHASMNIMGTGHLEADFNIPMGDPKNRHTYSGHLTQMNLEELNPILENTIFVKIRSGHVDSIAFQVNADQYSADGFMEFGYQNLKVNLVSKKNGNPLGIFRQLGSYVANLFVKDDNTAEMEDGKLALRQGEISYKRDKERSVVNYWVKTLVDGFKSSIGF